MAWFKGNIHSHSATSDGDIGINGVVFWYASRGYDWLAITDHNIGLNAARAERLSEGFNILVIPGIEVTGTGHVVGLGVSDNYENPKNLRQPDVKDSLQTAVTWIREKGGLPVLAHPNWGNVYDASVMAQIEGCNLFEVHNGAPDCNTFAAGGEQGTDEKWNDLLNLGHKYYGLGGDDSHHFLPEKFNSGHSMAHGGNSATHVNCEKLDVPSVLRALETGNCVVSSGGNPVKVGLDGNQYIVEVDDPYPGFKFTTEFVGPEGTLAKIHGRKTAFTIPPGTKWVRARVFCSSGRYMWTQPVWPDF
ncbi:MAG: CehA/McbA family metallohydrolase [Lentisphaerae bacterium]|nr:CehA/McbA family metallohydrolase [Lentisphaerota bacterium]